MSIKTAPLAALPFAAEHIPIESKIFALCGPASELHPLILQSLLLRAARGDKLGVVIGDNRLDAYALARLARAYGFDPARLLAHIEFSRPFTGHQLHHGILNLAAAKASDWRVLYVLGLLETFWDEDIRYTEATRLLHKVLLRLQKIAAQGLSVLITISPPPKETTRVEFITRVLDAADAHWLAAPSATEPTSSYQIALW